MALWAWPGPVLISRICQNVFPPTVAFTRTFAPMPERFERKPTHLIVSQALL
jgi:hypothetical protein